MCVIGYWLLRKEFTTGKCTIYFEVTFKKREKKGGSLNDYYQLNNFSHCFVLFCLY